MPKYKVKKSQKYSGDVPQMSSPYPEVGYWTSIYLVVDKDGKTVSESNSWKTAKRVANALNKAEQKQEATR